MARCVERGIEVADVRESNELRLQGKRNQSENTRRQLASMNLEYV